MEDTFGGGAEQDGTDRPRTPARDGTRVSVFGLGYVGCVLTACLSEHGFPVTGVDVDRGKVQTVDDGGTPVSEPGVGERIAAGADAGRIRATTDAAAAVAETDLSFLTVGTPAGEDGTLDTSNLFNVVESVQPGLADGDEHTFVVRSTTSPGTTRELRAALERDLDEAGVDADVDVLFNPEFLREGAALDDFYHPPYVVIGALPDSDPTPLRELYAALDVQADVEVVRPEVAEALKLVNNTFHALKICFANEVGSLAAAVDVDGARLMDLVQADRKLNVSPAYMDPGLAFGGACLPKDSEAIASLAEAADVDAPLLRTVRESNRAHVDRVVGAIDALDVDRVGIAGVSFKSGTGDVRNSPGLRVARGLSSDPALYARNLDPDSTVGSNREYLESTLSALDSRLVTDADEFLDATDAVVLANGGDFDELFPDLAGKVVVDPVGAVADRAEEIESYHSVAW